MKVQSRIEGKLVRSLELEHFEVINESGRHNVPPGSESHFKVIVVSDHFMGMPLLGRHRVINDLLSEELAGPVHALSVHPYTRHEWQDRQQAARVSPPCLGGEKRPSKIP